MDVNRRRLDDANVTLMGLPLPELRCRTRTSLLGDSERPAWVIGHQPEFIHPGVWFKHLVADRMARVTDGVAVNLIVDSDVPKSTGLRVVRRQGDELIVTHVLVPTAEPRFPYEHWPAVTAGRLAAFRAEVRQAMGAAFEESLMPGFFEAFGRSEDSGGFVEQMARGRRVADELVEAELLEQRISRCWGGPLLGEMLLNAERFAAAYNAALADYRRERRIRSATRPMPDLQRAGEGVELPLWVYAPAEPRRRLFVARRGDTLVLFADTERVAQITRGELGSWCQMPVSALPGTSLAVRPRALTLTLWARLLLADLFLHGIGGAKYDRITDGLIRRYFGMEPPEVACATATLRLALGLETAGNSRVREAARRLREWRYNPHRLLADRTDWEPLWRERESLIEAGRRLRTANPHDHAGRRENFIATRRLNQRIRGIDPHVGPILREAYEQALRRSARSRAASSREYFVGLYASGQLRQLAARFDAELKR